VELADFIRSVRRLAGDAQALSETADASGSTAPVWPVRRPPATADGETARPETRAKAVVRYAAIPPVVFNTLLTGTPFEGVDQQEMAKWNRYATGLFQIPPAPAATWFFGNGVSEIAGFPDDAELQRGFGRGWGRGAVTMAAWRAEDGHVVENDIAFNPAFSWSLDDAETSVLGGPLPFRDYLLGELAYSWGDEGEWDPFDFIDFPAIVSRDSVTNIRFQSYQHAVLFGDDAEAVRSAFPGTTLRDGLISSYTVTPNELNPFYEDAFPSVSTVRRGGHFLMGPVKIENPGTVTLVNPVVEVYLVPRRFSLDGAILLKRSTFRLSLASGAAQDLNPGKIAVPGKTAPGTYYFAFVLRDPKDVYQDNNTAWGVRLTVTK
jgi:hypothetical protein